MEISDAVSFAISDWWYGNRLVYRPNRIAASFSIGFSSNAYVVESVLMAAISHEEAAALNLAH